jgi:hypothetical protein
MAKVYNGSTYTLYVGENSVLEPFSWNDFEEVTLELKNLEKDGFVKIDTGEVPVPIIADEVDLDVTTAGTLEINPSDPNVEPIVIDTTGSTVVTVETSADAPVVVVDVEDGPVVVGTTESDTMTVTVGDGEPVVVDVSGSDTVTITAVEVDATAPEVVEEVAAGTPVEEVVPEVTVADTTVVVEEVSEDIVADIDNVIAALEKIRAKVD